MPDIPSSELTFVQKTVEGRLADTQQGGGQDRIILANCIGLRHGSFFCLLQGYDSQSFSQVDEIFVWVFVFPVFGLTFFLPSHLYTCPPQHFGASVSRYSLRREYLRAASD